MLSSWPDFIFVLGALYHWAGENCCIAHGQVPFPSNSLFCWRWCDKQPASCLFPFFSLDSVNSSWETVALYHLLPLPASQLFYFPLFQFFSGWWLHSKESFLPSFRNTSCCSPEKQKEQHYSTPEKTGHIWKPLHEQFNCFNWRQETSFSWGSGKRFRITDAPIVLVMILIGNII